jgi:hypothetical protein
MRTSNRQQPVGCVHPLDGPATVPDAFQIGLQPDGRPCVLSDGSDAGPLASQQLPGLRHTGHGEIGPKHVAFGTGRGFRVVFDHSA